jgi:hypothetical protein
LIKHDGDLLPTYSNRSTTGVSTIETNTQTNYSNSRLYLLKQAGFQELGRKERIKERSFS